MRLTRFAAAVAAAALAVIIAMGTTPALAATQADGPAVLVQTLDGLWAEDQSLGTQVATATATLDRLDGTVAAQGRSAPRSVFAQIAAQEAIVHSLQARQASVTSQIDQVKSVLAERGTQVGPSLTAPQTATEQSDPRMAQVDAIIATIPYPVRTLGVRIVFGDHPAIGPAWGAYDRNTNSLYIGETAFASETRLRYTVAHELAHAYEERMMSDGSRQQAFAIVSSANSATAADELFADCLATIWGAGADSFYWSCPVQVTQPLAPLVR
ncbi:MAG: hypothetical protein WDA60_05685 [Acidimicrobiia bacterium]|jgi:hypothetical protein